MRTRQQEAIESGFSLVEIVIAAAILFLVIGSVTMMGVASDRGYRTGATVAQLEEQTALAIDRVSADLRVAVLDSVELDGSGAVTYVQAIGFSGGPIWSTRRRLAFELEPGELEDGIDNNGNGLADEGRIVLTVDADGPAESLRVLSRWVPRLGEGEAANGLDDNGDGLIDERGLSIQREGDVLIVRLSLEKRDPDGRLLRRTARTGIQPRN
jgi:hypothetical protein